MLRLSLAHFSAWHGKQSGCKFSNSSSPLSQSGLMWSRSYFIVSNFSSQFAQRWLYFVNILLLSSNVRGVLSILHTSKRRFSVHWLSDSPLYTNLPEWSFKFRVICFDNSSSSKHFQGPPYSQFWKVFSRYIQFANAVHVITILWFISTMCLGVSSFRKL